MLLPAAELVAQVAPGAAGDVLGDADEQWHRTVDSTILADATAVVSFAVDHGFDLGHWAEDGVADTA